MQLYCSNLATKNTRQIRLVIQTHFPWKQLSGLPLPSPQTAFLFLYKMTPYPLTLFHPFFENLIGLICQKLSFSQRNRLVFIIKTSIDKSNNLNSFEMKNIKFFLSQRKLNWLRNLLSA